MACFQRYIHANLQPSKSERDRDVTVTVFLLHWRLLFFGVFSQHWTTNNWLMMIYESGYEKVAVAGGVSMADEPKIKRTRHILVIILTVFIVSGRSSGTSFVCFEAPEFVSSRFSWCLVRFCPYWNLHQILRKPIIYVARKSVIPASQFFGAVLDYSPLVDIMSSAYVWYVSTKNLLSR